MKKQKEIPSDAIKVGGLKLSVARDRPMFDRRLLAGKNGGTSEKGGHNKKETSKKRKNSNTLDK